MVGGDSRVAELTPYFDDDDGDAWDFADVLLILTLTFGQVFVDILGYWRIVMFGQCCGTGGCRLGLQSGFAVLESYHGMKLYSGYKGCGAVTHAHC